MIRDVLRTVGAVVVSTAAGGAVLIAGRGSDVAFGLACLVALVVAAVVVGVR